MRRALLGRSVALVRDVRDEADHRGASLGVIRVRAPSAGFAEEVTVARGAADGPLKIRSALLVATLFATERGHHEERVF